MPKDEDRQRAGFAEAPRLLAPVDFNGHRVAAVNPAGCAFASGGTQGAPGSSGGASVGSPRRGVQGPPPPAHPLRPQPSDVKFSELGGVQGGLGAERVLPRRAPALPGSRRRASSLGDVAPCDAATGAGLGATCDRKSHWIFLISAAELCPARRWTRPRSRRGARAERGGRGTRWGPWPARTRGRRRGVALPRGPPVPRYRVSVFRALDKGERHVNANPRLILSLDRR